MVQKKEEKNMERYLKSLLKDPMLLKRIVLDGLDETIVGEDDARITVFMCAMGSLVKNANHTSYNLMVNSESGAGKDYLTNNVLKIFQNGIVHKRTRISPTALTYWHNSVHEPNWTWDGKVLYLEDVANDILNCDVFKVFTSGGSYATIVKDQKAIDIKINGKPVVIITSASAEPQDEMLRRFMVVNLDESIDQTKEIMEKWAEHSIKGKIPKLTNDYQEAIKYLEPRKVKIKWAKKIVKHINSTHIHMRTHFSRFLDMIKAFAIIHQYNRHIDTEGYVHANKQDYEYACRVLISTSSNKLMVPLTKNQQEIIHSLKEIGNNIIEEGVNEKEIGWTHAELCAKLPYSRTQIYRELNKLNKLGFINKEYYKFEYDKKASILYNYEDGGEVFIPSWEEINK